MAAATLTRPRLEPGRYPAGYMLEARVAVQFLGWPRFEVESRSPLPGLGMNRAMDRRPRDFIVCTHERITTPDRLYSLDWCPTDREWVKAVGWPQLSRDRVAATVVAAELLERHLIDPTADLSAHDLCLRALEHILSEAR